MGFYTRSVPENEYVSWQFIEQVFGPTVIGSGLLGPKGLSVACLRGGPGAGLEATWIMAKKNVAEYGQVQAFRSRYHRTHRTL